MARLLLYSFAVGALLTVCALFSALITVPMFGKHVTPGVLDPPTLMLLGGFFVVSASAAAIAEWRSWTRMDVHSQTLGIKISLALGAGVVVAILGTFTVHVFRYARESFNVLSAIGLTALVLYLLVTSCLVISFVVIRFTDIFRHRT
jgi:hypothetical protein